MSRRNDRPDEPGQPPPARIARASNLTRIRVAILVVAAILIAAAWLWRHRTGAAAFERRADQNVLLITIDTLRTDALGCYGGRTPTPAIDALAAAGIRFAFAHAHAVLTRPSHSSILTGLYPYEHGVRDHSGYRLAPGTVTIATVLKQHGYATGAFVSGVPLERRFGLTPGFDVYDDFFGRTGNNSDFSLAERPAGETVQAALKWIQSQQGRWFAWVHVFDPHAPYTPPAPFDREYADRPYYGEVAYTDAALGPLLGRASSGPRPTLVILTSDHGEGLGEHGELTHGLFAYESTLHVPLIVTQFRANRPTDAQAADTKRAHTVENRPVRLIDIAPTILDALQIDPLPAFHGRSLLPGTAQPEDSAVTSYFEAMSAMLNRGWAPLSGVVAGREKYIELPIPELYDLASDPGERTNLVEREPARRRALEARLQDLHAPAPGDRYTESPEVAQQLQALGYTSGSARRKARYTEADDPKNLIVLDQLIQQGIEAWQHGKRDDALAIYERVIDERPSMAIGYRNRALLQWQDGDPAGAIATLERAFRNDAVEPGLTTQLGSYLAEAGRPSDAIALLGPVVAGTPADTEAANALGIALARAGRVEESLATFRRLLQDNPNNVQAYENIGTAELQRGNLAAAREALEKAAALDPRSARAQNGLGVIASRTGRQDEAFAHWRRAVELAPQDFDALFNLATELQHAGRTAEARPYLERFVREAPPGPYRADVEKIKRMLSHG